jgi:iron complex transport system permease protein
MFSSVEYLEYSQMLSAFLFGGILGLSGCVLQTFLRNPIAGPGTLGLQSLICFILIIFQYFQWTYVNYFWTTIIVSVISSLLFVSFLIYFISRRFPSHHVIIFGLLLVQILNFFQTWLLNHSHEIFIKQIHFWYQAAFPVLTAKDFFLLFLSCFIFCVWIWKQSYKLNLMIMGEEYLNILGFYKKSENILKLFIPVGVLIAISVALCGPVAFIGFLAPQLAKRLFGREKHEFLIITSFLSGSFLAVVAQSLLYQFPSLTLNLAMGPLALFVLVYFFQSWQRKRLR